VIPRGQLILLDTNVVIELARDSATGRRVLEDLVLTDRPERPLASLISLGEALALAEQWNWGATKRSRLREIFGELVLVDLSFGRTPEGYGRITAHARKHGLGIGENDRWIAAVRPGPSRRLRVLWECGWWLSLRGLDGNLNCLLQLDEGLAGVVLDDLDACSAGKGVSRRMEHGECQVLELLVRL